MRVAAVAAAVVVPTAAGLQEECFEVFGSVPTAAGQVEARGTGKAEEAGSTAAAARLAQAATEQQLVPEQLP